MLINTPIALARAVHGQFIAAYGGYGGSKMLLSAFTRQAAGQLECSALSGKQAETYLNHDHKRGRKRSTGSKISFFSGLASSSL